MGNSIKHFIALRLESELNGDKTIELKGQFLERLEAEPSIFNILEAEQRHLEARRETVNGHISILEQRIDQLDNEIKGLQIQRAARVEQFEIFKKEIVGLRDLNRKGYYPTSKLLAVERAMAELRGAAGNDLAQIARAQSAQRDPKTKS